MKVYDKQYINGEWRVGSGKGRLSNYNPYSGELLYEYQSAGEQDVNDAYAAAHTAQREWGSLLPAKRREYLDKLAAAVMEMKDEVFSVLVEEGGSALPKANFEYYTTLEIIQEAKSFPEHMCGKIMPSNIPGKENYIIREPKGVIGVIAPWNVPLVLAMRSVVPAVATGNTVVLKPASDTPATAFLIASFFEKAGFPKGVMNAVAGKGSEIGDVIVNHPIPSLISFTGSTEVGKQVGSVAGGHIKDVSLELGGNNVMLILPDADLTAAAKAAAFGSCFNSGQVCMALNRILVHESKHDEFIDIYRNILSHMPVGDPAAPETFIGPIINKSQVDKINELIRDTIASGAKVVLEGKTEGNLIYPWILTDVTNDMPAAKNEVFGPVSCIIRYKSEEEAIAIANDTEYGLSGSVFAGDLHHGTNVAKRIESGMVHVNDQSINDEPHVMFGGVKSSGIGRFNGAWVADKFTRERWISVQADPRQWPF